MTPTLIDYARTGKALHDVPVFDAHGHIGDFPTIRAMSVADTVAEMDRVGVDCMAISSVEAIYGDIAAGNDAVAAAARAYPGRFLAYCHVSARYTELMLPELERCFAQPEFKAIKVYQAGVDYDDPLYDPTWAFARDRGLPVLAHTWGNRLTGIDRAAQRFPEVAFLAAHAGSGFAYDCYIEAAHNADNLYLDLTYSREHTNMIEHMIEAVGVDRVVWGSDTNCFSLSQQLGKLLFARIPDTQKRAILYDNAAALFGLQPTV